MKKNKIIISVLSIVVVALAICVGVLVYNNQQVKNDNSQKATTGDTNDKIKGVYFRKLYGSVGAINSEDGIYNTVTFKTDIYAFNSDIKFLNNKDKLSFDNDNVHIESITVGENPEKDNDLTKYTVSFNVGFATEGNYTISTLVYDNGDKKVEYPMGKVTFAYKNGESIHIPQGISSEIKNKAEYYFLKDYKQPFVIKDLVSGKNDDFTYTYKKNVKFTPGKQLAYSIDIDSKATNADSIIFSPMFEIKVQNSNKVKYLVPFTPTYGGDNNLTYDQIKEYVSK